MGWTSVTETSQSWTTQSGTAQTWGAVASPSVESRLNRLYPQSAVTQEDLSYIWRIQTEFPWYVASATHVEIRSGVTEEF